MKKKLSLGKVNGNEKIRGPENTVQLALSDDDEGAVDSANEPSAFEALLLRKNGKPNADSKMDEEETPPVANPKKKNDVAEESLPPETEHSEPVSGNDISGISGEDVGGVIQMGSTKKLKGMKARKRAQRKRKLADGEDLSTPKDKTPKEAKSVENVFTSILAAKYNGPEEIYFAKKPHMMVKKAKKKKKKIQKIVVGGKLVEYLDEEDTAKKANDALIIPDSEDEEYLESAGSGEQDEDVEVNSVAVEHDRIWPLFKDYGKDEEVPGGGESVTKFDFFVKCDGRSQDTTAQSVTIDFEEMPFSKGEDSVQNGLDAFQWLIRPFDIKLFFKTVFQKKAFHVYRENRSYYGNLFSTAKFVNILQRDYVEYGTNVNIAVYKNQQRSTLNGTGKVYPWDVKSHIQSGCSVQFTNPQSFCDTVWYYCDLLQEIFGCFVGANTYITPANKAGFAPHWDDIDAFLLQLEGRKHWKVYAPVSEDEMLPRLPSDNFTDDDMADRTPVFDGWLEEGDLLYIPRGFIHQGFADENVHSLHLTVSVCRNVTYADLLESVARSAVPEFALERSNLRKSLPIGYLDMAGLLECEYPLLKMGMTDLRRLLAGELSAYCKYVEDLIDSGVDMMALEFMKTALPPVLTKEEKNMTALCFAGSSLYDDKRHVFTTHTLIKLLRRHGQRLIFETAERCYVIHRMANSRVYEGRPEVSFDLDGKLVKGFANLVNSYPKWCTVSDLKCDTIADSIRLAGLLYSNGILMAKFPNVKT